MAAVLWMRSSFPAATMLCFALRSGTRNSGVLANGASKCNLSSFAFGLSKPMPWVARRRYARRRSLLSGGFAFGARRFVCNFSIKISRWFFLPANESLSYHLALDCSPWLLHPGLQNPEGVVGLHGFREGNPIRVAHVRSSTMNAEGLESTVA